MLAYVGSFVFWRTLTLRRCAKGDIGIWQMRDMDPLPHWVKGRTIIIGDAAHPSTATSARAILSLLLMKFLHHPVLPHQGAGALSALEDAEALGTFLRGTTRATAPTALRRVFRARLRRVSGFQAQSRAQSLRNMKIGEAYGVATIRERWEYPGAEAWERERPEMVLAEAEE
jgi:2-polyprenyl-6-methoxyphenol hydroxylase-like FAD-dependent oxidoreductase